jgi:DNA mismatch repair protein MutL
VADIIQLLPDAVANQIAAGEVVQRPASAVKELMENAIDAGANEIKLVVKDAGKTLIQVIDNGCGMSETDARMSFERHATSKIKKSEDLFQIMTKGFRGEALASIAAIAQVELRTRQRGNTLGTLVINEGSKVKSHEPVQCSEGTNFQIKNLFFNVPARRYFLKSDAIELRHIIDEFQRLALTHPDIAFSMHHNGAEMFSLPQTTLRQRIVHVLGSRYNEKLVPVEEFTDIVKVSGFVGKPDASKKSRGEQFFFVNQRFIKNQYLHHAVMTAFEALIPQGHFPLYLLYLEIDPEQIDINIHPTKTEIKFQDERAIYAILHAAVRRGLGKFAISPSLDFEQEISIPIPPVDADREVRMPSVKVNPDYNPFEPKAERSSAISGWFAEREKRADGWQDFLEITKSVPSPSREEYALDKIPDLIVDEDLEPMQLHRRYVMLAVKDGLLLIDQQRAHQRILFERYHHQIEHGQSFSQQLLFPETAEISVADYALLQTVQSELEATGFKLTFEGDGKYTVWATPADMEHSDALKVIDEMLGQIREDVQVTTGSADKIAWAMAKASSIKYGQMLTQPEMTELVQNLMGCTMPNVAQPGKKTMFTLGLDQLIQYFK